ncbi:MAG: membrane protein insertase YidC [Buchnera aphidicola (Chaetogeoica yunlongensis)]
MYVWRNFFVVLFFFISFLLWETWKQKDIYLHVNKTVSFLNNSNLINNYSFKNSKSNILVKTDVLKIEINLHGGDIEKAELLNFKSKLNSSEPLVLLNTKKDFLYQVQSGLVGKNGLEKLDNNIRPLYISDNKYYELSHNKKEIKIPLTFVSSNGVIYKKIFILKPGQYDIIVKYEIDNITNKNLELSMYGKLKQTLNYPKTPTTYKINFSSQTFRGAAYSSDNNKYVKCSFDSIINKPQEKIVVTHSGWIAMLQKYFVTAWIPDNTHFNTLYTNNLNNDIAEIGYYSNLINISPHSKVILSSKLWVGPEIQDVMANIAPHLDLTVDYGWLWFLSQPLFKLLKFLYSIFGNWGISIILITFIIRGLTFPLTKFQFKTMIKLRDLQPKINFIKEKFKNNKRKLSEEIVLLYKKKNVNPLGGCLPLIIQMPIFLALYYMLIGSVELRHSPFIFWIKDLSDQDPYYILPVLMGLTMFFIQRITPNNISDPLQKNIMNYMPIFFTVFFLWFPSGLVLYYVISNLITIIQQKLIIRNLNKFKQ